MSPIASPSSPAPPPVPSEAEEALAAALVRFLATKSAGPVYLVAAARSWLTERGTP